MPFIPDPNTVRVEMVFSQESQIVENVYHVEGDGPWDVTGMTTLAGIFKVWWVEELQGIVANNLFLQVIKVRSLESDTAPAIEYTAGLPLQGADGGDPLPNHATVAIKWITGLAGRSNRGRTYHLGTTSAYLITPNTLDPVVQGTLATAYQSLISRVDANSAALIVASFFHGVDGDGHPIPRTEGVNTAILTCTVNQVLDSQRRRLPERGS